MRLPPVKMGQVKFASIDVIFCEMSGNVNVFCPILSRSDEINWSLGRMEWTYSFAGSVNWFRDWRTSIGFDICT